MFTRNSLLPAGCHLRLATSVAVLAQAGLMSAAMAMPAPSIAGAAKLSESEGPNAAQPMLYLAQNSNDGYAKVPHLRPQPEKPPTSSPSTPGAGTGSGAGATAPRVVRPTSPPAPRDSRDSDRK